MIIILNFGSQYAHLISRRVRELGSYSEILPFNASLIEIKNNNPKGIILSGGPCCVNEKNAPSLSREIFNLGIPILGICYGQQIIAKKFGGKVETGEKREYGSETIDILNKSDLFEGLPRNQKVWFSHGDLITKISKDFKVLAKSKNSKYAVFAHKKKKIFGIQFHPEVTHTKYGIKILENFIYRICEEEKNWKMENIEKEIIGRIKERVEDEGVIIGVSGGIDSFVSATLLKKAIGKNLCAVFIDNGLLRNGEANEVISVFKKMKFKNFYVVDASRSFLKALKGVLDPERKRKIIGKEFIKFFEKTAKDIEKQKKIKFLAQGTIYPDRIESAQSSKNAVKIKSHHNVVLPKKMKFQIIEPICDLYKDEVRALAKKLFLPNEIIGRHPFPGPGLAIRVIGEVTRERLVILRKADSIYISELKKEKLYDKIWQAFAVLLPVKSVGVMGDSRTYENIISLRAVTSIDGMTADWKDIPKLVLEKISNRIINEVKGVNRVLYDISQKPPATIEYE